MAGAAALAFLTTMSQTVALAVAGWVVIGAAAVRRLSSVPMAALVVVLALIPMDYLTKLDGGSLTLTKLIFPAALGAVGLKRVLSAQPLVWSPQASLVLGFGITATISFLVNVKSSFAVTAMTGYAGVLPLFFFVLNVVEKEGQVRVLLVAVVVSCLLSALAGIVGLLLGRLPAGIVALMLPHAMRLIGLSSVNPNTFGSYVLTALLITAYFVAVERRRWVQVALMPVLLLLGVAIVLTRSRAVSFVAVASALLLMIRLRRRVAFWKTGTVAAIGFLLLFWIAPADYFERLRSLIVDPEMDRPFLARKSFNDLALTLWATHPVLGVGPGNFSEHFNNPDFRFVVDTFGPWKMIHSLFLGVACHMGTVGLLLLAGIVWRAFADLNAVLHSYADGEDGFLRRAAEAVEVALFSFLLNAAFLPAERDKYLWILFGLCAAMARIRSTQLAALREAG